MINELENEISRFNASIAALKDSRAELQKTKAETAERARLADENKEKARAELSETDKKISETQKEISENEWKIRELDAEIEEKRLIVTAHELKESVAAAKATTITKNRAQVKSPVDIEPLEFEVFCAEWLKIHGYENVELTPKTNDFGADIIAHKSGERYACQCKHYNKPVGNEAVQKILGAAAYYDCDKTIVFAVSGFTPSAIEMAEKCGCELVNFE